ncbi:FUSC family protein [Iningainema tapete]|nr:aromatic acid exporter family protein [Iningainema tapete]
MKLEGMKKPSNPLQNTDQAASKQRKRSQRIITRLKTWVATPNGMLLIVQTKMALKMAVASAISYVIAQRLHWEYPFYAVIAAIIVMSSTHGSTLKQGVQRIIGSIIGTITGAIFAVTLGSNFWSLGTSVFLTIFLANYWKFNEAAKLAGYVSAIVILTHNQSPWLYAWGRFLETLLGIGVALLVNKLIFPTTAQAELRRCLSQTLVSLEQLYGLVIDGAFAGTYDRSKVDELKATIINHLLQGRELWKEVRQEQINESAQTGVNEAWQFLLRRIWEHILTMEHTILARQQNTFWQIFSPHLTQLAQETRSGMLALATAVKSRDARPSLPEMEVALTKATERFNQQQEFKREGYPIDELLRFFTFFYTMEEVGRKLQRMADLLSQG